MKLMLFFFIFLGLSKIGQSQIVQSSCVAHDSIKVLYQTDADRLAVRNIIATNSSYIDSVIIQVDLSERILNAMLAVYNATGIAERDTVIDEFNIHTYINPSLNLFTVKADSIELWMQNIKNNISPTGNNTVDNLVNTYGLSVNGYYSYGNPSHHIVNFQSLSNLNIIPLTGLFETVNGVSYSNVSHYPGDGNDINASLHPNYVELIYKHGYGDCLSGCIFNDFYIFKVYTDCSVEFVSKSNVGIKGNEFLDYTSISIYPNPVNNELYITNASENSNYVIVNLLGVEVKKGRLPSNNSVNTTGLNSGVYFIKIGNSKSIKFIRN